MQAWENLPGVGDPGAKAFQNGFGTPEGWNGETPYAIGKALKIDRLYTMNGSNWTDRYPRIIEEAARIKGAAILDAEVVCLDHKGVPQFDTLHSRTADQQAVACAFDLLMRDNDDVRKQPLIERKAALGKLLIRSRGGIQYVEHAEGHGDKMFAAVCDLGLEGIVSKKLDAPYRSGPSKSWIKVKNPKAPAATRVLEGTF